MRWLQRNPARARRTSSRILLITDRYLPEVGGTITWFHNMCVRFPAGSVWVVTQDYPGARGIDAAYPAVRVRRTALRRYPFLKPESLLIYLKLLALALWTARRRRIEVVHAGKVLPEGLVASWVRRILGIPYLVYVHGEEITILGQNPVYAEVVPRVYQQAAALIANSEFTKAELMRLGVRGERIARINPGVDAEFFRPGPKDPALVERYGLEGKTVLLSVGRLVRHKGHDKIMEALAGLLSDHPEVVYLIVSRGEDEDYFEQVARELGVEHAVRFAGEVAYGELPRYYNTSDIFVLANRREADGNVEGFGIVFLEANACAKPVIAGASGGTGDAVRHEYNGLRVEPTDADAIRGAIERLVADPKLRERLGRQGRMLVEAECTWDRVFDKVCAVSESLSESARNPA